LVKVALTIVEVFKVMVHELLPTQPPPLQPENDPLVGVAVSVTTEPTGNVVEHLPVHLMPAGVLLTTPFPGPPTFTVRVTVCRLNAAVTVVAPVSVTVQLPVPLHPPPLQLTKVDSVDGLAVRVTTVPFV
jgi:hypothetical protein